MKRLSIFMMALLVCGAMSAQSMKVVVKTNGEEVGQYVKTNTTTYTVSNPEEFEVPKAGHKVVTYSAENGQGVLFRNNEKTGNFNVRQQPNTKAPVVARIPEDDTAPMLYPCLGKVNGWYKTKVNGKIGYIREDLMWWNAIDIF